MARRVLLRHWIARYLFIEPEAVSLWSDGAGQPTLAVSGRKLFCSVSARGDWAGFALAGTPVGVDIEPLDEGPIAWAALSPAERLAIEALPPAQRTQRFLRLWTVKEAYLKALGTGLWRDPADLEVSSSAESISICDVRAAAPISSAEVRQVRQSGGDFIVAGVALSG